MLTLEAPFQRELVFQVTEFAGLSDAAESSSNGAAMIAPLYRPCQCNVQSTHLISHPVLNCVAF